MATQECILYELKPGAGSTYDRLHSEVPPEVMRVLSKSGFSDYSIFRRGDLVVSVYRRVDANYRPSASERAVVAAWDQALAPLFERTTDSGGALLTVGQVFRLD